MKAIVINSDYPNLERGREYEVKRVWSNYHITLEGSPRLYDIKSFSISHRGKPMTYTEAYKRDGIDRALRGE